MTGICSPISVLGSIFDSISIADAGICQMGALMSSAMATGIGRAEIQDLILIFLAIEIMITLIYSLMSSGSEAIQRGTEAIVTTAFVFALTAGPMWNSVVVAGSRNLPDMFFKAMPNPTQYNSTELKGQVLSNFGDTIRTLWSPAALTTTASMLTDIIPHPPSAATLLANSTRISALKAANINLNRQMSPPNHPTPDEIFALSAAHQATINSINATCASAGGTICK